MTRSSRCAELRSVFLIVVHSPSASSSVAVEGDAGGATAADQSNKMANTVSTNNRLRKTYNPVNVPSARRFDDNRTVGAKQLERKVAESISSEPQEMLLGKTRIPQPLK